MSNFRIKVQSNLRTFFSKYIIKNLCQYIPLSSKSQVNIMLKLSFMIADGYSIIDAFKKVSETSFS